VNRHATYGAAGLLGLATEAAVRCPFDGAFGTQVLRIGGRSTMAAAMAIP